LETLVVSALVVALAEIGDKTQLLAMLMGARYRKPWPIIAGILGATIASHLLASLAGYYVADMLNGAWFRYGVGFVFIAMAIWSLIPDRAAETTAPATHGGIFLTALIGFFVVEVGDKTQIATIALAARFHSVGLVAIGTTVGMLAVDVPSLFLAGAASRVIPLRIMRGLAAALFLLLGIGAFMNAANFF
jgi:Ca2+/H+ antiporter, TMEM165/GDT1 family